MEILSRDRLKRAKKSFATRRVDLGDVRLLMNTPRTPRSGDLVLARVTAIGSHKSVELETGRKAILFPGDEVILAYGNRYAPDQYEAYVPTGLGPCHMVAAGGIAANAVAWHDRLSGPTAIEPLGFLCGQDETPINLADHALPRIAGPRPAHVFAVFGTSMNAGKSTLAASLVKGFSEFGLTVGTAKITGTGAGGDLWMMKDSGATEALDFTDAGMPSTFEVPLPQIVEGAGNLLRVLRYRGCDVAVVEIADGLGQAETAALARDPVFLSGLSGTFFAAGDAMGAAAGADRLTALGHRICAVSGAFTRSPLAIREAVSHGLMVATVEELSRPAFAATMVSAPYVGAGSFSPPSPLAIAAE
ncbi:MAG: DUF1611 domain-containing protein [Pseudomonadota bacterium]